MEKDGKDQGGITTRKKAEKKKTNGTHVGAMAGLVTAALALLFEKHFGGGLGWLDLSFILLIPYGAIVGKENGSRTAVKYLAFIAACYAVITYLVFKPF